MKFVIVSIVFVSFLFAANGVTKYDKDNQKIFELLADNVNSTDNIIHAIGHAILVNKDIYTLADQIDYDMLEKKVQASGDVRIYREGTLLVRTKSAFFSLDDEYGIIEPLYLQDTETGMWVSSKQAQSHKEIYSFKKATISGCAIQNPIWRMDASSGSYSDTSKVISLWNPRVYIGDIPIFYLPYFRIPTDMTRQSGLLMPYFLTSSTEGFVYAQPYYIAPKHPWDITITPQFRTERGVGGQIEFRGVDSSNDRIYLDLGYLYNFDDYMNRYNVKNKHVFGGRFYHLSNRPLQKYFKLKSNLDNGFYLDFLYMNDLDYYRIKQVNKRIYSGSYTSKMNIYLQTDKHYFGLNLKYFINLMQLDNASTFQSLPNVQYHKYLDSLFFKGLLYSIDYQFKNTIRKTGYGMIENGITIPIGIQLSFLKKYVSLGVWTNLYAENLMLTNKEGAYIPSVQEGNKISSLDSGNIASFNYNVSLNTDISRSFNKFFHTIQFETIFSGPYASYSDGLLNRKVGNLSAIALQQGIYNNIWDPASVSAYSIVNRTLDLKLTQYFMTRNGKEILNWRIFERLNFDELSNELNRNQNGKIDPKNIAKYPLENKFNFSLFGGLSLTTSIFYSFYSQRLSEIAATLSYSKNYFSTYFTYYYKDTTAYDYISSTFLSQTGAHYLRANIAHDFGIFSFSASAGYDIQKNTLLDWDIGIYKNIRCFGIGLRFINRRRPILTNDAVNPYYVQQDYYIRLLFNFVPLTGAGLTTRFK